MYFRISWQSGGLLLVYNFERYLGQFLTVFNSENIFGMTQSKFITYVPII
jgi:hypothetical protein